MLWADTATGLMKHRNAAKTLLGVALFALGQVNGALLAKACGTMNRKRSRPMGGNPVTNLGAGTGTELRVGTPSKRWTLKAPICRAGVHR
jgi:hypothetical protein